MPLITIDMHAATTTPDKCRRISDALHQAMREVLAIPDDDRFHIFHQHPDGLLIHDDVAFGVPRDDQLILITLSFNQRDSETKQRLFATIVRLLEERADVTRDQVMMRIVETARDNWWASGRVVDPETGYDERMEVARA